MMLPFERESRCLSIAPLQHKEKCGIRVGPDLFRSVSALGYGSSLVRGGGGGGGGGRVQIGSLLLKTDHINT